MFFTSNLILLIVHSIIKILLDVINKTNKSNPFISSHVIEQFIGKSLPLISVNKSVLDLSTTLAYQQMI